MCVCAYIYKVSTKERNNYYITFIRGESIHIYPYLPTPLLRQDMTQGQFLSGV